MFEICLIMHETPIEIDAVPERRIRAIDKR